MTQPHLVPISQTGPMPYPLPRDLRIPTHYFITWWHNRWLNSSLHLTGSYEVQGVALALYCIAQNQSPMGTLPVPADKNSLIMVTIEDLRPIRVWASLALLCTWSRPPRAPLGRGVKSLAEPFYSSPPLSHAGTFFSEE